MGVPPISAGRPQGAGEPAGSAGVGTGAAAVAGSAGPAGPAGSWGVRHRWAWAEEVAGVEGWMAVKLTLEVTRGGMDAHTFTAAIVQARTPRAESEKQERRAEKG